ncbi:tRNA uridine-5-carboxymethylaminomethyl(34) synthesis enzyme MnmG [Helcococcus kunzii]|uniref:tRNA uridine-5-carboxymethylaminomethyl(34) synthesis enzyme MnmG n=1 Tax=Helcococcus kunzii TaxID=40091 RepID=UPI001BB061F4|nr:tRNA uridine-5-carboxymethylaminomethyl(34) synthesis enzyme MnmG [Helcococcus kunzii]MCT1796849.1 tRNA uridine-5-carboxymethylaminomethyl(34) synthesis enzyme MnmG [Helcococcus kunzii]MCT1988407.1 tRNA uridine-5-carboxymethylaminomethyl(34) synthesis enzyme MnmG [Helcococcus kunzii]QUY65562.1 tRNA uridine-5-carboxymethylaminomethyl(34) synthesis enzyme MnmG [Helcococcus kunzii]
MEIKKYIADEVDVFVVGAGHAGIEAALSSARLGKKTIMASISLDAVADLPCNPNIGGTGKGHLVREIDALGGEMALNIDKSSIQSKMLNTSKGPAIHSLRVQADKRLYHEEMKKVLENEPNLRLIETEIDEVLIENNEVIGVSSVTGAIYKAKAVIICTGTYLNGLIMMGELQYSSGPHGMKPALYLSDSLENMGFKLRRFKTGTPARVNKRSLDFSKMIPQYGDENPVPFSFMNVDKDFNYKQELCWQTHTTPETHEIIRRELYRSPMYAGVIEGIGPRYCPSIEDKVVRFADKDQHIIFIEPEGKTTNEMYVQGASSTLPVEVQQEFYKTIIGLENVEFMRPAHGIEYDCIDATNLKTTLESFNIKNLFFAGQINGTSGYEEAAAQGLMAGINAVHNLDNKEPFILDRSEAYIGVLIDDLVTKAQREPYRMMTSRAEYRLTLRQDNADLRLTQKGYEIGLVSEERYQLMLEKKEAIEKEVERLKKVILTPTSETNEKLLSLGTQELKTATSLYDLIKRPELDYETLEVFDPERTEIKKPYVLEVQTQIKYEGYIKKQNMQIDQFKKMERKKLDMIEDYTKIDGLKKEAAEKLNIVKPDSVGQASRMPGVTPADINVIMIHLEVLRRKNNEV